MVTKRAQPFRSDTLSARAICQAQPELAPEVAHLPRVDEVVERGERLLDRRGGVEAVDLVEVDGLHPQPPQARLARLHDVLAREPATGSAPSPIGLKTLVARTISFRSPYSRSARPVTSSLTPSEYMSAVSKKLMPASMARRKKGRASSSSSTHGRHFEVP